MESIQDFSIMLQKVLEIKPTVGEDSGIVEAYLLLVLVEMFRIIYLPDSGHRGDFAYMEMCPHLEIRADHAHK